MVIHPPGGIVGGDILDINIGAQAGAHGLITTPGATRFYRSEGEPAQQLTRIALDSGARLEWLPHETICYSGCIAESRLHIDLMPDAEFIGWDVTALGLPHAKLPFLSGQYQQHIEMQGLWLERGRIDAIDKRLLNSPLGLGGQRCIGTMFFLVGSPLGKSRCELALEVARNVIASHELVRQAGATSPDRKVVMVRVLAAQVEPAMDLLRKIWSAWRPSLWQLSASSPRVWST